MKSAFVLLSPLAVFASTVPLAPRQLPKGLPVPKMKAFKMEETAPKILREGVKSMRIWYGPFQIRGADSKEKMGNSASMDPAGTSYNYLLDSDFPHDITVLTSSSEPVYADGSGATIANGIYNHHMYFADTNKRQPSILQCPNGRVPGPIGMSFFMGGGEDDGDFYYAGKSGTMNAGYYIAENDILLLNLDLVNYTNETKTVYALNDIQYIKGKIPGARESSLQILGVDMCDAATVAIHLNPGEKATFQSKEMTFTVDGEFLAARGHLHDGGVNIVAEVNGKEFCNSEAKYGGKDKTMVGKNDTWETISEMVYCTTPAKVKKGDKLMLKAYYDLGKHPARESAHGSMAEGMALLASWFAID